MIENVLIKDLKLTEKNPRRINKEQFEKLCKSMEDDEEFISCRPILVNRVDGELNVYAGNQRIRAAKKIGWKYIPCIIEDDLDEEVMKKRLLLDNTHFGDWDFDMLSADFDNDLLLDSGFTEKMLFGHFDADTANNDDNTAIPEIEDVPASEEQPDKKKKQCPICGHEW